MRHRGRALPARVRADGDGGLAVALGEPADGVAPGQTAALYRDGRLVAAGTIAVPGSARQRGGGSRVV